MSSKLPADEDDLRAFLTTGNKQRQARFFEAVSAEWRPHARRFLHRPSEDEVEDLLHDALVELCLQTPSGERPRVLAPPGATNPQGWRTTAFKNFCVDRARKRRRRTHADSFAGAGHSPRAEAEAWRAEKAARRGSPAADSARSQPTHEAPRVESGSDDGFVTLVEQNELNALRAEVIRLAERLAIHRRVILLLSLEHADPSPFAEELARRLHESPTDTLTRIDVALRSDIEDPTALPRVRVPWPVEPEVKARESARKALERAREDLIAALRERSA